MDPLGPWETLSSKVVFEHPFMTLVEDVVKLPNGKEARWLRSPDAREGVEVANIVAALCVDGDRVLISRQYCHAPQRVVVELPAGGVEPAETPEDAMRRELMEEVGLHAADLTVLGTYLHRKRRSAARVWVFEARNFTERTLPSDDAEIIESEWVSFAELERMITENAIEDGTLLAAWTLLRLKRPELFR